MLLHLSLLHILILLLPPPPSSASLTGARPGCPDRCGNVSIPYPFGVGSHCSLDPYFTMTCNTSTHPPEIYLPIINSRVNEITDEVIKITFPILALSSYGRTGNITTPAYDLSQTPYMFSDHNWLTAIGCDDMAAVTGHANRIFGRGCIAYCRSGNDAGGFASCPDDDNDYVLGSGCCRSPIPIGTTSLAINLSDVHNVWRGSKLFNTSYAFIGQKVIPNKSEFSYRLSDLNNATIFESGNWVLKNTPQVLLDWRIGTENCSEARKNTTTYVCKENSHCVDFDLIVGGYLCNCSDGYEGNPYLELGCQDINECDDSPCHSKAVCTNTPGNFSCSCRKGYSGDGMKDDYGCQRASIVSNASAGVGSGVGFFFILLICLLLIKTLKKQKKKMRKEKFFKQNGGLILQQRTNEGTIGETKLFLVKELKKATDNFNKTRILGQGGQGTVYKGMLSNGQIVAIKKSKLVSKDQVDQFINEVVILSQINHRNMVRMLGCCLETEVPQLVYEFLPNGTLSDLIHDPSIEVPISWNVRLKIAADVAGALAYLHSSTSMSIYHRDIKSSNILLDEKYVVKVSDFGISRSIASDQTHLTTGVKGTFGYFDPEYFQSNQFTGKSDVYSFGVVLAELLTGQRPISLGRDEYMTSLVTRFLASIEDNNVDTILDPQVLNQGGKEEVIAVVLITQKCLNLRGIMRPTMKEVATELESLRLSQMPSTITHQYEEAKFMMIPDNDYTWTASDSSEIPPSCSDIHPFKF